MACAVPVVASPVGANLEAVPPESGLLVGSPEEWLAAFRLLEADPALRLRIDKPLATGWSSATHCAAPCPNSHT
jgi:glycosyltransferase involved in cell wall biosynthesis